MLILFKDRHCRNIVNKSLILSEYKSCKNGVIKSANKNEFADIVIDGKGDLLLQSDTSKENVIKLTDDKITN